MRREPGDEGKLVAYPEAEPASMGGVDDRTADRDRAVRQNDQRARFVDRPDVELENTSAAAEPRVEPAPPVELRDEDVGPRDPANPGGGAGLPSPEKDDPAIGARLRGDDLLVEDRRLEVRVELPGAVEHQYMGLRSRRPLILGLARDYDRAAFACRQQRDHPSAQVWDRPPQRYMGSAFGTRPFAAELRIEAAVAAKASDIFASGDEDLARGQW